MRTWLLQGKQGEDPGGLRSVLRQWFDRPGNSGWRLEVQPLTGDLSARVQVHRPEVVIFAAALSPIRACVEEMLAAGPGLLIAADEAQSEGYCDLAERHPLLFVPPHPTAEAMAQALWGIRAALRREQYWRTQVEQLNQRLNDRIVIERAKGVLVQRLGIGEEEAYKRLRILSRRQRRQIRDIAQSLLDTQALLLPPSNGFASHDSAPGAALEGEQSPETPGAAHEPPRAP
jgi:response regulator NasT